MIGDLSLLIEMVLSIEHELLIVVFEIDRPSARSLVLCRFEIIHTGAHTHTHKNGQAMIQESTSVSDGDHQNTPRFALLVSERSNLDGESCLESLGLEQLRLVSCLRLQETLSDRSIRRIVIKMSETINVQQDIARECNKRTRERESELVLDNEHPSMLQSRSRSMRSLGDLAVMQRTVEFDRSHRVRQSPLVLDSSTALGLDWCVLVCWPSTIFDLHRPSPREESLLVVARCLMPHLLEDHPQSSIINQYDYQSTKERVKNEIIHQLNQIPAIPQQQQQ